MELSRWSIFSILNPDFAATVVKACVFGRAGNEAIIITRDDHRHLKHINYDDVYALGTNCSSCLGLGDSTGGLEPKKIDVLCQQKVIDIGYGSGPHVLAITERGELFSWGDNSHCQQGNAGTTPQTVPVLLNKNLTGKVITQVACGSYHSLVLTQEGEVYAWGQNNCGQVGSGSTPYQLTPFKITSGIGARRVVQIACGQISSVCVLDNGEVFGWGYSGNGQLGLGITSNQYNPCQVAGLAHVVVSKVTCGYAHTMALTDGGDLYAWGANSYGQLGTGNKATSPKWNPVSVGSEKGRFMDIAASRYTHISAAITYAGMVYMWGECRGQSITEPTETLFCCLDDVFACYAMPAITFRALKIEHTEHMSVAMSVAMLFDDPATSDVKVQLEGKIIHVHKVILKSRCEHFRSMFQSCWEQDGKDIIEISQFTYPVYRAFLQFLYTDRIDLSLEHAIGLLDLANSYLERQLKALCERTIKQGITVANVAMLYAAVIQYEEKELEEFCLRFALNHMTAVTQSEAFAELDEPTLKRFIQRAAKRGAFKY